MEEINLRLVSVCKKLSLFLSLAVIAVGTLVLVGWQFDTFFLKSMFRGLAPMTPQSAVCFITLGFSLFLLNLRKEGPSPLLARSLSLIVWLVGLMVLCEYFLNVKLGIDALLFSRKVVQLKVFPGRMAPHSALNFMLASSAVILLSRDSRRVKSAQAFTILMGCITLLALTGYIYGISSLYSYGLLKPIALHSALTFLLVFFAVLFLKPDEGVMSIVLSTTEGGTLMRRLLSVVLTVPFAVGLLIDAGVHGFLYDFHYAMSLFTVFTTSIFTVLVWKTAVSLHATDIRRIRTEKQLQERNEFAVRLVENSTAPTFVLDTSHRVLIWNKALEQLTEVPEKKIVNSMEHWKAFYDHPRPCMADLILDGNSDECSRYYTRCGKSKILPGGWHGEGWFKDLGGKRRYIVFDAAAICNSLGERIAAIETLQDITDRVVAEEKLFDSEERYRQLMQNIPVGLYRCASGVQGKFIMANPTLARMFGYDSALEIVGTTMIELFNDPEERVELYRELEEQGNVIAKVVLFKRRDTSTFWCAVTAKLVRSPGGAVLFCDGMVEDITERRRIEEMKSDFVSLVSHQLKTPVAEIKGFVYNMLVGVTGELNVKQRQYLEQMQEIAQRNYRLISDLLNVSRIERGVISVDLKVVDLKDIVDSSLVDYFGAIKGKGLELVLEGLDNEILVMVDKDKCVEAVANVISNAIKFTEKGSITIRAKIMDTYGLIEVEDTGQGMSAEAVQKLFQKETALAGAPKSGGGAGLGLYIGRNFMLVQSGDILVESSPGTGAKFTFKIPLAQV